MSPFVRPRPHPRPTLRLIVFHHAAGSAAVYYPLIHGLPQDWDLVILDLPGRGKRHAETPLGLMPQLVERAVEDVQRWLDVPVALFGHSLGAILAVEVGRCLESMGYPPAWLGISGRVAPSFQAESRRRLHEMDDGALMNELLALGGTPDRISEFPEFRERFLRIARADLSAAESYAPAPSRMKLSCPLTTFGGTSDAWAPPSSMHAWARETSGSFQQHLFPGGHFYFLGAAFAGFTRKLVEDVSQLSFNVPGELLPAA
jgi:surfactin synthase thioesterase subunit